MKEWTLFMKDIVKKIIKKFHWSPVLTYFRCDSKTVFNDLE